jgi:ketosteroid isomerase-like protein
MIGAIIMKRLAGSGFNAFSQRDLAKLMAAYAEDSTFTFPGNTSMSGETKDKKQLKPGLPR